MHLQSRRSCSLINVSVARLFFSSPFPQALALCAPSKTRNGPLHSPLLGIGMGPVAILGAPPNGLFFFHGLCRLFGGFKINHECGKHYENHSKTPNGSTKNACLFKACVFTNLFLAQGKVRLPHFLKLFFLPLAVRSQKFSLSQGLVLGFLWKPKWAPGLISGSGRGPISGRQVLSVSVVLSASVEGALECQMTC